MNFLSDQDNKKMIKKAGEFLEGDFHVIINYSGMPLVNLSSPLLDPTGVSGSANVNRADKTFAHDIDQMNTVQACRTDYFIHWFTNLSYSDGVYIYYLNSQHVRF